VTSGFVSIVGAGPGAVDLLTLRALRCLRRADLVLHDGLVPRAIVRMAPTARHQRVSRRPGAIRPAPGDVVELMIDAVRRGDRVVRLRAGDPFVFARGAEEVLGLVAAGVPFEIVPGLTTASAAPALAGIPLTHRGVSSGFLVLSGHSPATYEPVLEALEPHSITVVLLMGLTERANIAGQLCRRGWRSDTPVAIITNASRPGQCVWRGSLRDMSSHQCGAEHPAPGVIVIGDVVSIGAAIDAAVRTNAAFHHQEVSWRR
jgi:uroporphyrin-III C-methyltransferase/precorrin-2 dehydrogenase/sirohydrochlorin ferrochelatase